MNPSDVKSTCSAQEKLPVFHLCPTTESFRPHILMQYPGKCFCCSHIRLPVMITRIPFQCTIYAAFLKPIIPAPDAVSDLCHNRISRLFLFVTQTQINSFALNFMFPHIINKSRKPDGRRYRSNSCKHICLVCCP